MGLRVRMLRWHPGRVRDGKLYPPPGEVMELAENDRGDDLLEPRRDAPWAELVEEPAPVIETTEAAPAPEVAARVTKPKPRTRKS